MQALRDLAPKMQAPRDHLPMMWDLKEQPPMMQILWVTLFLAQGIKLLD